MDTYAGELKASTKYRIYAQKARDDGFEQIGSIFDETSGNEKEHAEIMLELLNADEMPSTKANLKDAVEGESDESKRLYREFAKTAREEGFEQIGDLFDGIADIEKNHSRRFGMLLKNIEDDEVFCKPGENWWICTNCGNLYRGKCAPQICPVCGYPQGYYELYSENY